MALHMQRAAAPPDLGIDPSDLAMMARRGCRAVLLLFAVTFVLAHFLYICRRTRSSSSRAESTACRTGRRSASRSSTAGAPSALPVLESVSRMDVRLFGVEVAVQNAFSKGGIPLTVHAIANVKIATDPRHVRQAVERFLGMRAGGDHARRAADARGRAPRGL